ncbi:MAG: pentapeptide repeat-containing protein [Pseudomonadales bacterium]|nr:pentapeptide repeat-containing protein [Pseudomonadales bacterium]
MVKGFTEDGNILCADGTVLGLPEPEPTIGQDCPNHLVPGADFTNCDFVAAGISDFSNLDLSNANFSGATIANGSFEGANLTGTNFSGARVSGSFEGANLNGWTVQGASFSNLNHAGGNFAGTHWSGAEFIACNWSNADLTAADFSGTFLSDCTFEGAGMRMVKMNQVVFDQVSLNDAGVNQAELTGAMFVHSTFLNTDFSESQLVSAYFVTPLFSEGDNPVSFRGASLVGVVINSPGGPGLMNIDWTGADMTQIKIRDAQLYGSDFTDAVLLNGLFCNTFPLGSVNGTVFSNTTCPNGVNSDDNGGDCVGARLINEANLCNNFPGVPTGLAPLAP